MSYRTVQLADDTYSRLVCYRARLEVSLQRQPERYPPWLRSGRLSLDSAVSYLMDQQERHACRSAAHKKRLADASTDPPDDGGGPWSDDDTMELPPRVLPRGR